jgi:hypothetical protein
MDMQSQHSAWPGNDGLPVDDAGRLWSAAIGEQTFFRNLLGAVKAHALATLAK